MSLLLVALLGASAHAGPHTLMLGVEGSTELHAAQLQVLGATRTRCYAQARICVADFAGSAAMARAKHGLLRHPQVRWVEVDRPMPTHQQAFTDDHVGTADCFDLWELDAISLDAAFDLGIRGAAAPVVAIQDTGFYEAHVDFGAVSGRYDYGDWNTGVEVVYSVGVPHHGTFIAGILNGVPDNGRARAGIVPEGRVNLQKIADSSGALYFSYAVSAMADLAEGDLGVRVLSYSIGGPSTSTAFADAVEALGEADIVVVAAAANCGVADCWDADNDAYPVYPASYSGEHILSVAGSTRDGSLNPYSHYGAWSVDLAAPGVDICSLGIDSTTDVLTAGGTSYATPIVAGAAALLLEAHPDLTAIEVARVVRVSAAAHADLAGKVRSGGNLDVDAALHTAVPRLIAPADAIEIDGEAVLELTVETVADAADAVVVLTHPEGLTATLGSSSPTGWTAQPFSPGDAVTLPDAGEHIALGSGTVLTGPVAAHTVEAIPITWRASTSGTGTMTARLVMASAGADYLNAPYQVGADDETGFLAYSSALSFTAAPEEPTDTGDPAEPEPELDSGTTDTSTPDAEPPEEPVDGAGGSTDKSGCSVVPGASGLALVWGLCGVVARRRQLSLRESPDAP